MKDSLTRIKSWVQLSTVCGQLELTAADGKQYKSDVLDADGVNILLTIRGNNTIELLKWIKGLANPIDEQSRVRAYDSFISI